MSCTNCGSLELQQEAFCPQCGLYYSPRKSQIQNYFLIDFTLFKREFRQKITVETEIFDKDRTKMQKKVQKHEGEYKGWLILSILFFFTIFPVIFFLITKKQLEKAKKDLNGYDSLILNLEMVIRKEKWEQYLVAIAKELQTLEKNVRVPLENISFMLFKTKNENKENLIITEKILLELQKGGNLPGEYNKISQTLFRPVDKEISTHETEVPPAHLPPNDRIYCQLCQEYHSKQTPYYQCKVCNRQVCLDCYTNSVQLGKNTCVYCDNNLIFQTQQNSGNISKRNIS